jgi:hypothetical protein
MIRLQDLDSDNLNEIRPDIIYRLQGKFEDSLAFSAISAERKLFFFPFARELIQNKILLLEPSPLSRTDPLPIASRLIFCL